MTGGDRPLFGRIRRAVATPVVGPMICRLNANPLVVRMMVARHVYSDPRHLTADRMREKRLVIASPGARFSSVAFVTGGLDHIPSRAACLAPARRVGASMLVAFAAGTPPRSRAEMEALIALPLVQSFIAANGKLGFYEEYPQEIEPTLEEFLRYEETSLKNQQGAKLPHGPGRFAGRNAFVQPI